MTNIHNTSLVDSSAEIHETVIIGPYCIMGPNVKIDKDTELKSNVIINGHTSIGKSCVVYPFSVLGNPPRFKLAGEKSDLIIGDFNIIREHVTMNPGTKGGDLLQKLEINV